MKIEETVQNEIKDIQKNDNSLIETTTKKKKSIFIYIIITLASIIAFAYIGFTLYNLFNPNIISGVSIKGIDVSGLSRSDAKLQIENHINNLMPEEIIIKHKDFETTLSISQIEAKFDLKTASRSAFNVGRTGNIFQNNLSVINTMFNKVNIEPIVTINKTQLAKNLEDISSQLPDKVEQSSYYIEGKELIITPGKNRKCC